MSGAIFGSTKRAIPAGAVAFWPFNGDGFDLSGNGLHFTEQLGPILYRASRVGGSGTSGFFGGGNYGLVPGASAPWTGFSQLTFSAWVRPDAGSWAGEGFIIGADGSSGGGAQGALLALVSGLYPCFNLNGTFDSFVAPDEITPSEWTHLAATFDGTLGLAKIYVNGALVATKSDDVPATIMDTEAPALIAIRNDLTVGFVGEIDALGIWDRALSEAEIAFLYNSGKGLEPSI